MSHFLVTGGAGFIGQHLCRRLLEGGAKLRVLDDLSSGHRSALPQGVELIQADICDPAALGRAMEGVDGVVHLAAVSSVEACTRNRAGTGRVNLGGTQAVAAAAGQVPIVFTSSAAVYGDQPVQPVTEAMELCPISPYAEDKVASERCLAMAAAPAVVLRPFNVFGPGQCAASPYSGVISRFVERAQAGQVLRINGTGGQTRDFIHVADVARALTAAMDHALAVRPRFAVANVCRGHATSVRELAEMVQRRAGLRHPLRHGPPREGDIQHSLGDPSAARRLFGFEAEVPVETGLDSLFGQTAALTDSSR